MAALLPAGVPSGSAAGGLSAASCSTALPASTRSGKDCACSAVVCATPASQGGRLLPASGLLADSSCVARLAPRTGSCSPAGNEDGASSPAPLGAREERPRRSTLPTMEGLPLKDLSAFLQIGAASSKMHIRALASSTAPARHVISTRQHSTALYWWCSRQEASLQQGSDSRAGSRQATSCNAPAGCKVFSWRVCAGRTSAEGRAWLLWT